MKRLLLIILLLGCSTEPEPDTIEESIVFIKILGENGLEYGRSVQQITDGGYIIVGNTSYENNNIFLIKTDSNGNEQWNQTLGGSDDVFGYSVYQTTDDGYVITGNIESDAWLIKTDSEGNEEWNQTFGGSSNDKGYAIQQTTDGGYIIVGVTLSFGNGGNDAWLIKTDSNGNEEWNQTFGGSWDDGAYSVQQTIDGGYIITGYTEFLFSIFNTILIKTDSQGNTADWPE